MPKIDTENKLCVIDIGSTTTKAILFVKDGDWRFYRREAPTTVEKPQEDVTIGVAGALQALERDSGTTLLKDGRPCLPCFSTSSAGGGLAMVVAGLIREVTSTSAERVALGAGAIIQDVLALNDGRPLYNMAAEPVVQTAVATPAVQTIAAPVVAPGIGSGLSGQFQCIAGCAGGSAGPAFVTKNGWDLNLVNEIGQPSRAWIDWPGHIWVQSWNEGAVYSADGMTIQFDNGSVWARNVVLVVPPVR